MITHLQINGFGKLRGALAVTPGVNAWVAEGHAGKSTLAALLYYLFYPEDSAGRALCPELRPLAAYAPWGGGDFSASATWEFPDGRVINIWRDFSAGRVVALAAADGREVTPEFMDAAGRGAVGEKLFGLTAAEFAVLALSPQAALPSPGAFAMLAPRLAELWQARNPERRELLSRVSSARAALVSRPASSAPAPTVEEEKNNAETAIASARRELAELESAYDTAETVYAAALRNLEKIRTARAELERGEYLVATARLAGLDARESASARARTEYNRLSAEEKTLVYAADADFSADAVAQAALLEVAERERELAARREELAAAQTEHAACERRMQTECGTVTVTREQWNTAAQALNKLSGMLEKETARRVDLRHAEETLHAAGVRHADVEKMYAWLVAAEASATPPGGELPALLAAEKNALARQTAAAERQTAHTAHARMLEKIFSRDCNAAYRHWGLALALLVAGVTVSAALSLGIFTLAPVGVCGLWAAYGGWRYRRAVIFHRTMTAELVTLGAEITAENSAAAAAVTDAQNDLAGWAEFLRIPPETLRQTLAALEPLPGEFSAWRQIRGGLDNLEKEKLAARDAFVGVFGTPDGNEVFDPGKARFRLETARKDLALRERTVAAWNTAQNLAMAVTAAETVFTEKQAAAAALLRTALRIEETSTETLTGLAARYHETREAQARYREIHDRLLPEVARQMVELPSPEVLANNRAHYQEQIRELLTRHPDFAELAPAENLTELEASLSVRRAEIAAGEEAVRGPEEAYNAAFSARASRAPELRQVIAEQTAALAELQAYTARATETLAVAETALAAADAAWTRILADKLNAAISRSAPELAVWKFTVAENLELAAVFGGGTARQAREGAFPEVFSRGQLELLYWQWRGVLNAYLAGDTPANALWPLFADEPLGNCPDAVFTAAKNVFVAQTPGFQTVIVSGRAERWENARAFPGGPA